MSELADCQSLRSHYKRLRTPQQECWVDREHRQHPKRSPFAIGELRVLVVAACAPGLLVAVGWRQAALSVCSACSSGGSAFGPSG
jgi:hypothetical protein